MEQPIGQRKAGCRAAGKVAEAPTKPQGTEKTMIYNLAEGRGESQEDQPTPRTNQKNGLEGHQGKAEELDPTRKVGKSKPEDNLRETEGYQQVCHKKDGEGQHELRRQPRQTPEPTRNSPKGERLEQEGPREREIWAEENEKKDWKPGVPDRSQQKVNIH